MNNTGWFQWIWLRIKARWPSIEWHQSDFLPSSFHFLKQNVNDFPSNTPLIHGFYLICRCSRTTIRGALGEGHPVDGQWASGGVAWNVAVLVPMDRGCRILQQRDRPSVENLLEFQFGACRDGHWEWRLPIESIRRAGRADAALPGVLAENPEVKAQFVSLETHVTELFAKLKANGIVQGVADTNGPEYGEWMEKVLAMGGDVLMPSKMFGMLKEFWTIFAKHLNAKRGGFFGGVWRRISECFRVRKSGRKCL